MIEELRNRLGFSFHPLEICLFSWLAQDFAQVLAWALQTIDEWIREHRDSKRFRAKGLEPRTLQTLLGVTVTFQRRRYVDRQTHKTVYLLDEVLQLPAQTQLSPGLAAWVLGQAVLCNTYRGAADSLEAMYGHRVVSHESIRQVVLAVGQRLEKELAQRLEDANGQRKVPVLFVEVDGLSVPLQRCGKKRRVEERRWTPLSRHKI